MLSLEPLINGERTIHNNLLVLIAQLTNKANKYFVLLVGVQLDCLTYFNSGGGSGGFVEEPSPGSGSVSTPVIVLSLFVVR